MDFDHVVRSARYAKRANGTGPLSTGESLAAALVLNRSDWLKEMNYTIAEALDRLDAGTIQHLRPAERLLSDED